MTLAFYSIASLWLVGLAIMFNGLHHASEAYEDETGFHMLWRNDSPEARDVCLVWTGPAFA